MKRIKLPQKYIVKVLKEESEKPMRNGLSKMIIDRFKRHRHKKIIKRTQRKRVWRKNFNDYLYEALCLRIIKRRYESLRTPEEFDRFLAHHPKAQRKLSGDVSGKFRVFITLNNKEIRSLGKAEWMSDAYELFNNSIEENKNNVSFPLNYVPDLHGHGIKRKYEILLIRYNTSGAPVMLKNKDGIYEANVVKNKKRVTVLAKNEWFVESKLMTYDYENGAAIMPYKQFIDMIFSREDVTLTRMSVMTNFIIFETEHGYSLIYSPSAIEAERLYETIERDYKKDGRLFCSGAVNKHVLKQYADDIEMKVGFKLNVKSVSKLFKDVGNPIPESC